MPNLLFLLLYFSSLFVLPNIPSLFLNEVAQSASGEDARAYLGEWEGRGELDRVIFLATPHRSDAKFNQTSLSKGGKVVNVYDPRDLV